MEKIEINVP